MEKLFKKSFWISKKNKKDIETEARKQKVTESALMRHIINNWYSK